MTSELLDIVENATVASSCGVLLTLLLRKPLRRFFGPSLAYFLWLLVPTSLLVLLLPAPSAGVMAALPVPLSMPSLTGQVAWVSMSSGPNWATWLLCTWEIGALLFYARLARQQRRFIASLGLPAGSDGGVLRATFPTGSPVVVGLVRPTIVVPSDFDTRYASEEQALILAHEWMHVRRGDLVMNALWALARCIFWFNPLIHAAARLSRFDQELACDAAVMRNHPNSRKPYASAMLRTQLADDALPLGCYWPSNHPLKERIMLLKQPPARGLRRAIGQILIGSSVCMVAYATWAVQSDAASGGDGARVNFADSEIRISSDSVQKSGNTVRYTGNVVLEIVGRETVRFRSDKASELRDGEHRNGDMVVMSRDGDRVTIDDKPRGDAPVNDRASNGALLEGNVQIQVDGRIFTTERAVWSASAGAIKMDSVEVPRTTPSDAIPVR
jgi:beta-lactamase regulating signal transducer with metallopeptidase domain